jgi:hypothetical protein
MGDGVNIAARLEGIAEPGGICLSEDAHRQGVIGSRTSSSTSEREREREASRTSRGQRAHVRSRRARLDQRPPHRSPCPTRRVRVKLKNLSIASGDENGRAWRIRSWSLRAAHPALGARPLLPCARGARTWQSGR